MANHRFDKPAQQGLIPDGLGSRYSDDMRQQALAALDHLPHLASKPVESEHGGPSLLSTGFVALDDLMGGLGAGNLVVLASRPGMGKSVLARTMAAHAALHQGARVCAFLQDPISIRVTSVDQAGKPTGWVRSGTDRADFALQISHALNSFERQHLKTSDPKEDAPPDWPQTFDRLRAMWLHVDDTADLSLLDLVATAQRLSQRHGRLGLIVLNSLECLREAAGSDSDEPPDADTISATLKALAQSLRCAILVQTEVVRKVEWRRDKRPTVSDVVGHAGLLPIADVIMLLYRDELYTKDACHQPGVAEVIVAKNNRGPTGTVRLAYRKWPAPSFESLPAHTA